MRHVKFFLKIGTNTPHQHIFAVMLKAFSIFDQTISLMRAFLLAATLITTLTSSAQYFYKDIIGTKESSDLIKSYQANKVSRVTLTSYDADNTKTEDFFVEQLFSPATQTLRTITRSDISNPSVLTSFIDAKGDVIKTVDSSEQVVTVTQYNYNAAGQLSSLLTTSTDSTNTSPQAEEHIWQYVNNKPTRMLRIRNRVDTTYIDFKLDEKGNVSEEQETHKGVKSQPVYYYYDDNNRLTDIVRYNNRARRLLPEYMFEYSTANKIIQRITVPANNSEYLIWRYQYNAQGLKTKEAIYNKQKKLTGKIEYQYSFSS
jgi:YD repeat-containing protein